MTPDELAALTHRPTEGPFLTTVLVDGMPGAAWAPGGMPRSVFVFTIDDGRVAAIDVVVDPDEIAALDIVFVDD